MNHYFDWYDMDDEHKVKFARMNCKGQLRFVGWLWRDNILGRTGFL